MNSSRKQREAVFCFILHNKYGFTQTMIQDLVYITDFHGTVNMRDGKWDSFLLFSTIVLAGMIPKLSCFIYKHIFLHYLILLQLNRFQDGWLIELDFYWQGLPLWKEEVEIEESHFSKFFGNFKIEHFTLLFFKYFWIYMYS